MLNIKQVARSVVVAVSVFAIFSAATPVFAQTISPTILPVRGRKLIERAEITGKAQRAMRSGKATISNGTITAKSGSVLTVSKDGKSYTVETDANTQFGRRFWGKSSIDEISVNDLVNVIGRWKDEARTTIIARMVRDMSIQKKNGTFVGDIKAITDSGFTMTTVSEKREDQTVTLASDTRLTNRRGETISKSDLAVGHRVRVRGMWNSVGNTITEVKLVKDFNLPVRATVTVTATP